jgi:hypothetical protein
MKKVYKTLIIFSLIIFLPNLIFGQEEKELTQRTIEKLKDLPNILIKILKEEILPFWKKLWDWFLENIWQRIVNWLKKKPEEELKERFEKGVQEEKKELEEEKKNFWQKFLNWLKRKWSR